MTKTALVLATMSVGLFMAASPAGAQQEFSRWEDLLSDHPSEFRASGGVASYLERPVRSQDADFSLLEEEFSASGLIYEDEHEDLRLSAGVRHEGIRTGAVLPDTGLPFPDELWNVTFGATYRYLFESGLVLGGSVGVGSASDDPFHSSREIVGSVTVFTKVPVGERDAWFFAVSYSNNREYANAYPIPVIEYLYNPSTEFHLMVGFPMEFLEWHPAPDWRFRVSYSLIHNIHALLSYEVVDGLRAYVGYDWTTQGYLLVDRPDPKDRFFYEEMRAKGGGRLDLGAGWSVDLSGGYAFDRRYSQSQSGLRNSFDVVEIEGGLYGLLSLEWRLGHARPQYERPPQSP
jgi:hypothetical protein